MTSGTPSAARAATVYAHSSPTHTIANGVRHRRLGEAHPRDPRAHVQASRFDQGRDTRQDGGVDDTAYAPDNDDRRTAQAEAFDNIGARYDEAFPHKDGQIEATGRLAADLPAGSKVLDVGCGTGIPTARMLGDAGHCVTGIDISPVMLELARKNAPEADFHQLDVLDLDPTVGAFDAAVAFFALLMLPRAQIPLALQRIGDVLRPGGQLLLAMVEADLDNVPIPFLGSTIRVSGYPRQDLAPVVEAAGFSVTGVRDKSYAPAGPGAPPEVQLFLTGRRR